MRHLALLAFLPAGCALHPYDAETARQIQHTLDYETEDFALTVAALADGVIDERERLSMEVRSSSELARLKAWLAAESAKDVTP